MNEIQYAFEAMAYQIGSLLEPEFFGLAELMWQISDWFASLEPSIKRIIALMIMGAALGATIGGIIGMFLPIAAPVAAGLGALAGAFWGLVYALNEMIGVNKKLNDMILSHFPQLANWGKQLYDFFFGLYEILRGVWDYLTKIVTIIGSFPKLPIMFPVGAGGLGSQTINMNLWIPNVNLRASAGETVEDFAEKLLGRIKRGLT